jgi:hypothetical protein
MSELSVLIPAVHLDREEGNVPAFIDGLNRAIEYLKSNVTTWECVSYANDDAASMGCSLETIFKEESRCHWVTCSSEKAMYKAYALSRYNTILHFPVDAGFPIKETELLSKGFDEGFEVVVGSRFLKGESIIQKSPWSLGVWRDRFACAIFRMTHRSRLVDTMASFALIEKQAFEKFIKATPSPADTLPKVWSQMSGVGIRIKEVGVMWNPNRPRREHQVGSV